MNRYVLPPKTLPPLPPEASPPEDVRYIVVDTETTGRWRASRMVELAWVEIRGGRIVARGSSLVNPRCLIPEEAQRIHGIDNGMVRNAPTAERILPDLFAAWEGAVLVAHNASYDESILSVEAARHNMWIPRLPILDTLTLSRLLLTVQEHSLGALCHELGIVNAREHRALSDAQATAELFLKLMKIWTEGGGSTFGAFNRAAGIMRLGHSARPLQNLPERMRLLPAALLSHSDVRMQYRKDGRTFVLEGTLECGFHHDGHDYVELWDRRRRGVLLSLRLDHVGDWGPLAD